jgi:threonine dehydrogenase-like Zn-dependent dehydrogenase
MSNPPAAQQAIQYVGVDQLILNAAKPIDPVGPTQLLLGIEACGICFSDIKLLHAFEGHPRKSAVVSGVDPRVLAEIPGYHPGAEPTVAGHEAVARVVAVGDQVRHFAVGQRVVVHPDWRHLPTADSNAAFGYNFEGGFQEYVVVDERIMVTPDEKCLLPVSERPSAAAAALVEPWSTVESSYSRVERTGLIPGGRLLVVTDPGREATGLDALLAAGRPGETTVVEAEAVTGLAGEFQDIIYYGSQPEVIEALSAMLEANGLLCVVLGGHTIPSPVRIDAGRLHYDFVRYIGTTGDDPAEAYRHIPGTAEIRPGDRVALIGAAGPMGLMHTMRTAVLGLPGLSIDAADISDERLGHLEAVVAPVAARHQVPLQVVNSMQQPLVGPYSYLTCLVPSPVLLAQAVDLAGPGAIVNVFAGFVRGTLAELDLQGIIERHIFVLGASGTTRKDMESVLVKLESGVLDTSVSLDAVCGMAGFADAVAAVQERTSGGKIMVYPSLHNLGLIRLVDLPARLSEADLVETQAESPAGNWSAAAELAKLARHS